MRIFLTYVLPLVLPTLVYVAFQIRQNTRALKSTAFHGVTDSFNQINNTIAHDESLAPGSHGPAVLWREAYRTPRVLLLAPEHGAPGGEDGTSQAEKADSAIWRPVEPQATRAVEGL